jgi:hypothetical protein
VVRYELTGKEAERVLAAHAKARVGRVVTEDSDAETFTFVVRSIDDVKAVAAYLGVDVPEGRGRFPMKRLEEAVAALGHTLDRSHYGESVSVLPGTYRVSLMELVDDKVYPRTGIVTGDQVRQFASGRGRPSKDSVASAAIDVHGWGDTYLSDSVEVSRQD